MCARINAMKGAFSILLIAIIVGVTIFGFLWIQTGRENNLGCFAGGIPCPVRDGMFAFALFHLQALKGSIANAFGPISFFVFLLLLVIVYAIAFYGGVTSAGARRIHARSIYAIASPQKIQRESWCALFEHSPSFLMGA